MTYNFDEVIPRHQTNSIKYDFAKERNKPDDLLPLWVADMDFKVPDEVITALHEAVSHGIYGYTEGKENYYEAIMNWYSNHYQYKVDKDWFVITPGIVYAMCAAVKAFTKEKDAVLIQRPVYAPFTHSVVKNNRTLINNPLKLENNKYMIDFEDFEQKIIDHNVKLFILCSPHNPVGRVWTKDELLKIGEICCKHNVLIVSDEIHADFTYPPHTHTVLASLSPDIENITITCLAPTKTFNIAGLQISNILIANEELRLKFKNEVIKTGYSQCNTFSYVASTAAYTHGEKWLNELIHYLQGNMNFLEQYLKENLPKVIFIKPEGTYLAWLDFNEYNLSCEELEDRIIKDAKLWLNSGPMFGPEGKGFQRINVACPRSILEKGLEQLKTAFHDLEN